MSNTNAIANVTAALQRRLSAALDAAGFSGLDVFTAPQDIANKKPESKSRLNIFLYHVVPSATWRNQADPMRVKPGETGYPPLGLSLHYILSAFGAQGDDITAHRILAAGMAALHDQPLFTPTELQTAVTPMLGWLSDLHLQVERVRITPQPLTTEEMYKLWSAFQTTYRVSAAYEVSVVLIDSTRPVKAALPALFVESPNGAQTGLESPYPILTSITPPASREYALLGDMLTLTGAHLDAGSGMTVRFKHRSLATPLNVGATTVNATTATVSIPNTPTAWPAGIYTVSCVLANSAQETNEVPFVLAPKLTQIPQSMPPNPPLQRNAQGVVTIPVQMSPRVFPGQSVTLLVGSQGISAPSPTASTSAITFSGVSSAGEFYLRLRVDGIDSPIVVNTPTTSFDPTLKVKIQ